MGFCISYTPRRTPFGEAIEIDFCISDPPFCFSESRTIWCVFLDSQCPVCHVRNFGQNGLFELVIPVSRRKGFGASLRPDCLGSESCARNQRRFLHLRPPCARNPHPRATGFMKTEPFCCTFSMKIRNVGALPVDLCRGLRIENATVPVYLVTPRT